MSKELINKILEEVGLESIHDGSEEWSEKEGNRPLRELEDGEINKRNKKTRL